MLRTLLECATRPLRYKRRLPKEFGGNPIWVSPSAGLRYLFRPMDQIDSPLLNLVTEFVKPGHVVWDIGANLGLFSLAAAYKTGHSGKVVAVEPDIEMVRLMRRTVTTWNTPVEIVPAAIADKVGLRTLHIASRASASNFLDGYGSMQTGGSRLEYTVLALTLDWLADHFPLPDILKIDVEGAEIEVLKGGKSVIENKRPIIICEVHIHSVAELSWLFTSHNYTMFDIGSGNRQPITRAAWNTLAIPY